MDPRPDTGGGSKAGSAAGSGGTSGQASRHLFEVEVSVFTKVQAKPMFLRSRGILTYKFCLFVACQYTVVGS